MRIGLIAILLSTQMCWAEYRAYLLAIVSPEGNRREVLSYLDPWQYIGYHHVAPQDSVVIVDSWFCPGATYDFKDYCAKKVPNSTTSD